MTSHEKPLYNQLEDLDFADEVALISHNHQQIQDKTRRLETSSNQVGLKIHPGKTKLIKVNTLSTTPVSMDGSNLEDVQEFTYLGSKIDRLGGTDAYVKARIGKAGVAFTSLKNIWNSHQMSLKTKLRFFNSNVKSVLLYGSETWRKTKKIVSKVQTFINGYLRKILGIFWPETINNKDLWHRTEQLQVQEEIKERK